MPTKRTSESQRPAKRLRSICKLLEENPFHPSIDYTDAETLEALVHVIPENARAQFEYASLLARDSRLHALKHFQKAVDLDPECAEFHFGLAKRIGYAPGAQCTCHNFLHLSQWDRCTESRKVHFTLAKEINPQNPDHHVGLLQFISWEDRELRKSTLRHALKLNINHLDANVKLANQLRPHSSQNAEDIAEARICAERALKHNLNAKQKACMFDLIAVCAEKQGQSNVARKFYDLALVTDPAETRNYHTFLKNRDKALFAVVNKFKRSFSVREDISVAAFFDRYAILTPGYRALLKKNNRMALVLMKQYAKRETRWMLCIHPFNDETFPKVVTTAIMDFLFHI